MFCVGHAERIQKTKIQTKLSGKDNTEHAYFVEPGAHGKKKTITFFYVFTAEDVNSPDVPQNMVQRRDFVIRLLNFQVQQKQETFLPTRLRPVW